LTILGQNKVIHKEEVIITDIKDLKVGKSDFIRETEGNFGNYYRLKQSLGLGRITIFKLIRVVWRSKKMRGKANRDSEGSQDIE
jgi:hypothetical protein